MKRILSAVLALTLLLALSACGQAENPTEATAAPVTMTPQEICQALQKELGESYPCSVENDEASVLGYYGLNAEHIDSWYAQSNAVSSVNMDQVIVVRAKEGYAQEIAEGLQGGFKQKAGYAQLYNMDLFRINEARLFVDGDYVALLILGQRENPEDDPQKQAEFMADEGRKVDAAWASIFGGTPENIIVIPEPEENQGGGMRPGIRPRE